MYVKVDFGLKIICYPLSLYYLWIKGEIINPILYFLLKISDCVVNCIFITNSVNSPCLLGMWMTKHKKKLVKESISIFLGQFHGKFLSISFLPLHIITPCTDQVIGTYYEFVFWRCMIHCFFVIHGSSI